MDDAAYALWSKGRSSSRNYSLSVARGIVCIATGISLLQSLGSISSEGYGLSHLSSNTPFVVMELMVGIVIFDVTLVLESHLLLKLVRSSILVIIIWVFILLLFIKIWSLLLRRFFISVYVVIVVIFFRIIIAFLSIVKIKISLLGFWLLLSNLTSNSLLSLFSLDFFFHLNIFLINLKSINSESRLRNLNWYLLGFDSLLDLWFLLFKSFRHARDLSGFRFMLKFGNRYIYILGRCEVLKEHLLTADWHTV